MIKLTSPGVSHVAHGKLANALIYSTHKARTTAKKHSAPKQPRTPAQVSHRAMAGWLAANWNTLTANQQATWLPRANDLRISPYHAYLSLNIKRWTTWRAPGKQDPVTQSGTPPYTHRWNLDNQEMQITFRYDDGEPPGSWGFTFHQGTAPGFTPSRQNCVLVATRYQAGWNYITHQMQQPGTYYFRCATFTADGLYVMDSRERTITLP